MIEGDFPETPDEQRRRLREKRAGKPGEGFADFRIVSEPEDEIETLGEQLYRLSRRMQKLCDYEDNPDQLMMHCPKCDLMNDFTINGQQIFYFGKEWTKEYPPDHSTTLKRISVIRAKRDRVICKCGNCGEEFEPEVSPDPIPFIPSPNKSTSPARGTPPKGCEDEGEGVRIFSLPLKGESQREGCFFINPLPNPPP